jgi:hypothetical protein
MRNPSKGPDCLSNLCKNGVRHSPQEGNTANPPIEAARVLAKHCSVNGQSGRKHHMKPVPLDLARNWTGEGYGGFSIEIKRGEHNRRSSSGLFMAGLGIEIQPDQVAGVRYIRAYQTSAPRGGPQSYSPRLSPSSRPSNSSSRVHRVGGAVDNWSEDLTSAMLPVPFGTHSTGSPTGSDA